MIPHFAVEFFLSIEINEKVIKRSFPWIE